MSESLGTFLERMTMWKKVNEGSSSLTANSLEVLESALWLFAGGRYAQALVASHNAVELAFKGELEGIHRLLIAETGKLDYTTLKSLLKESFLKHRTGKNIEIRDFDYERTIGFEKCLERLSDLYPLVKSSTSKLKRLQELRNHIVHSGADRGGDSDYVEALFRISFPFLRSFFLESIDLDIATLLGENIYREIEVAEAACIELTRLGRSCVPAGITVAKAVIHRSVEFPLPMDEDGNIEDYSEFTDRVGESIRARLAPGRIVQVDCKICGSWHAYAAIGDVDEDSPVASEPLALACAECGLKISESDSPLASIHFGVVPVEQIAASIDEFFGPSTP